MPGVLGRADRPGGRHAQDIHDLCGRRAPDSGQDEFDGTIGLGVLILVIERASPVIRLCARNRLHIGPRQGAAIFGDALHLRSEVAQHRLGRGLVEGNRHRHRFRGFILQPMRQGIGQPTRQPFLVDGQRAAEGDCGSSSMLALLKSDAQLHQFPGACRCGAPHPRHGIFDPVIGSSIMMGILAQARSA